MKIIFVRHGATASNKLGRIMSRVNDESLCEEGLEEVRRIVAEHAGNLEYDIVFTSPLKRAAETAEIFAGHKDMPLHAHDGIMEWDFGSLSNITWDEVNKVTNGTLNYEIWQKQKEFDLSSYGGEKKETIYERIKNFISHLKTHHFDKKPLVVTHGGVLRTLYSMYPNHTPTSWKNVSIHVFEV